MGRNQVSIEVVGSVSSHNSRQDGFDASAWEEFVDRVRMIAGEHRYEDLFLDVIARSSP